MATENAIVRAATDAILEELGGDVGPGAARSTLQSFARRLDDLEQPELASLVIEALERSEP